MKGQRGAWVAVGDGPTVEFEDGRLASRPPIHHSRILVRPHLGPEALQTLSQAEGASRHALDERGEIL